MENTTKPTFSELVEIFGKPELREIFKTKILEFQVDVSSRYTPKQKNYLVARMGPKDAMRAIDIGETLKKSRRKSILAYWCKLYLRVAEKVYSSNKLSDADIEHAKEFPTWELYDGEVIRSGQAFRARCVFHNEKTPSLFFYRDGHFHCFGCGVHGLNAIDYLMQLEKSSFKDTVRRLI